MLQLKRLQQLHPWRALLLGFLAIASPATGVAQENTLHCILGVGGGWTHPWGSEHKALQSGWKNFEAGAGIGRKPSSGHVGWAFTGDFLFQGLKAQPDALRDARLLNSTDPGILGATGAKARFYSVTGDVALRVGLNDHGAEVYFFAGAGWLRRNLTFTASSGQGVLIQPGSPAVFGVGGDSGAFDVGFGSDLPVTRNGLVKIYLQARVLHGLAVNHETTLVPITLGVRF